MLVKRYCDFNEYMTNILSGIIINAKQLFGRYISVYLKVKFPIELLNRIARGADTYQPVAGSTLRT